MPTVKELISGVLAIDPAANAVEAHGVWFSWGDIGARIAALEVLYDDLGLGEGARISVFLRNRIEPLAALFSVLSTDRCLVTVNPLYPDATLAADLATLRAPVFVAEAAEWARPGIRDAVRAMGAAGIELTGNAAGPARLLPGLERVTGHGLQQFAPQVMIEMLTSGTTGKPKRIPLNRVSFQHSFESALAYEKTRDPAAAPRLRPGTTVLHTPISHIGGLWQAINTMSAGRKACLIERFNVPEWSAAVKRHRPKVSGAPPAALRMILDAQGTPGRPRQPVGAHQRHSTCRSRARRIVLADLRHSHSHILWSDRVRGRRGGLDIAGFPQALPAQGGFRGAVADRGASPDRR